jgi:hypothetical protein
VACSNAWLRRRREKAEIKGFVMGRIREKG